MYDVISIIMAAFCWALGASLYKKVIFDLKTSKREIIIWKIRKYSEIIVPKGIESKRQRKGLAT